VTVPPSRGFARRGHYRHDLGLCSVPGRPLAPAPPRAPARRVRRRSRPSPQPGAARARWPRRAGTTLPPVATACCRRRRCRSRSGRARPRPAPPRSASATACRGRRSTDRTMNFPFSHPQVALCGACLPAHPCPLHDPDSRVLSRTHHTGTRCGARRKGGDGAPPPRASLVLSPRPLSGVTPRRSRNSAP